MIDAAGMPFFVDTNVLIYAVSDDPQDLQKRVIAQEIMDRQDLRMSVQVLQEFYVQSTRRTRKSPLIPALALEYILTWSRFEPAPVTTAILAEAISISGKYRLSYWDSAIIAAAKQLRCKTVLTEDLNHGQMIDGVRILNPFQDVR